MIVEYNEKYNEQIKELLIELQNYLIDIDDWHTQVMVPEYKEEYFELDMEKVKMQNGKIFLWIMLDFLLMKLCIEQKKFLRLKR